MAYRPGFDDAIDRAEDSASNAATSDYARLTDAYRRLYTAGQRRAFQSTHPKWWTRYSATQTGQSAGTRFPVTQNPTAEPTQEEEPAASAPDPAEEKKQRDAFDVLRGSLAAWGLEDLTDFAWQAVVQGKSYNQIIAELRQTEQYRAAFPENDLRRTNGFNFMPEGTILKYRDDAKRIAKQNLGIDVSDQEISKLIAGDVSLTEWESRLATYKKFERFGPVVKTVLEQIIGKRLSDDRVFAFLSPEISTPELDKAYEDALYRGRPALLGLGVRGEDEAEVLRQYGIDVDQAFRGYQGIVAELPKTERYTAIEAQINRTKGLPPNGSALFNDTSFATLFRAIQLGDGDAIRTLQEQMRNEVARFQGGGGVVTSGTQSVGLLTSAQRAAS